MAETFMRLYSFNYYAYFDSLSCSYAIRKHVVTTITSGFIEAARKIAAQCFMKSADSADLGRRGRSLEYLLEVYRKTDRSTPRVEVHHITRLHASVKQCWREAVALYCSARVLLSHELATHVVVCALF